MSVFGAFSTAMSGISSMFNSMNQRRNMQLQHQFEQENMAASARYQLAAENRQRMYDDPSAVSQRYRLAGMNPYAVMGSGQTDAGIQGQFSSAPSGGTSASPSGPILSDMGASFVAGQQAESQAKMADAQAEAARATAAKTRFDAQLVQLSVEARNYIRDTYGKDNDPEVAKARSAYFDSLVKQFESSSDWLELRENFMKWSGEQLRTRSGTNKSQMNLNDAQRYYYDAQTCIADFYREVIQPLLEQNYISEGVLTDLKSGKLLAEHANVVANTKKVYEEIVSLFNDHKLDKLQASQLMMSIGLAQSEIAKNLHWIDINDIKASTELLVNSLVRLEASAGDKAAAAIK